MFDAIIVGGGPAGIIAAGMAGSKGKKVLLIEKNEKLGKKLYITGKGRCNITNMADIEDFFNSIPTNKNFLYSALYSFDNSAIIALLEEYGVEVKVEQGNRVFPVSDKSSDVIKAFTKFLKENDVEIRLETEVKNVLFKNKKVKGVELTTGEELLATNVVVATGGVSYKQTGSTGDGYIFGKKAGHKIIKTLPALTAMEVENPWVMELQGISLRNVEFSVDVEGKELYKKFGEMLFTHFGISGPIVLEGSSYINKYLKNSEAKAVGHINLKPALSRDQLDKRLQRELIKNSNKQYKNVLASLMPERMIPVIAKISKIEESKLANQITKEERIKLLDTMQNLKFTIKGLRRVDEAIITSGGINVKEIDPSTMESKLIKGLYFAGEVLDVDALTGGYNLQIAYSTGYLAGMSIE